VLFGLVDRIGRKEEEEGVVGLMTMMDEIFAIENDDRGDRDGGKKGETGRDRGRLDRYEELAVRIAEARDEVIGAQRQG
jgi:hypothetical protein